MRQSIQVGTPSPVPRRLMKTPSRATLSPKGERAGLSHKLCRRGRDAMLQGKRANIVRKRLLPRPGQ